MCTGGVKMRTNSPRTLGDLVCDIIITVAWIGGFVIWAATIVGIIRGLMG